MHIRKYFYLADQTAKLLTYGFVAVCRDTVIGFTSDHGDRLGAGACGQTEFFEGSVGCA